MKVVTGCYICMDIQKTAKTFTHRDGRIDKAGILAVSVPTDQVDKAEQGFIDALINRILSPVGRWMAYVPARNKLKRVMQRVNNTMIRQHELRKNGESTWTDMLNKVTTMMGNMMTIQQVMCSLKDRDRNVVFTGAKYLGDLGRIMMMFNKHNRQYAKEILGTQFMIFWLTKQKLQVERREKNRVYKCKITSKVVRVV